MVDVTKRVKQGSSEYTTQQIIEKLYALGQLTVSDEVFSAEWDGDTTVAPSKNAVYDKIEAVVTSVTAAVSDDVYGAGWNGVTTIAPSKNAVYDKIETLSAGTTFSDSAFRVQDNGDATKQIALEASGISTATTRTITMPNRNIDLNKATKVVLCFSITGDVETLTTGTGKLTLRFPYAFTLTGVKACVNTAPTGSTIIVDINESGTTLLSTKLSIDISEKTSATAASAAVISDTAIADDAEISFDIDQIGSTIAGAGLKVWLYGYET